MPDQEVNKQDETKFSAYYLQQITRELSDDIDKVRVADDFKSDSVSFLVHALRQGSSQFPVGGKSAVAKNHPPPGTSSN